MKILFVSQYFYPESFKGNDIVFDLIKRGHKVSVLTAKPNYPEGKFYKGYNFFNRNIEIINGAKVYRSLIFPRGNGSGFRLALNYISFVFFSYFIFLFKLKETYDLVLVQQLSPVTMALPGIWVKRKKKTPLVLWVLDLWPESLTAAGNIKNKFVLKHVDRIVKYIYNNSDLILTSSKSFDSSIKNKLNNKAKEIRYFPNWAEDYFSSDQKIKENSIPKLHEGFNIMFAGNIGEAHDFESVLKSAELTKNDNINWILVGDGRKVEWIKKELSKKEIENVFLLGRYPIETMPSFFKMADVMLVSLKNEPIFSLTVPAKIQAYMASGKVIVGMLNGEGNELINRSKSGIAVSAGKGELLANAVLQLKCLDKNQLEEMEKNSLLFYKKNFEKNMLMNRLEKNLEELKENNYLIS